MTVRTALRKIFFAYIQRSLKKRLTYGELCDIIAMLTKYDPWKFSDKTGNEGNFGEAHWIECRRGKAALWNG